MSFMQRLVGWRRTTANAPAVAPAALPAGAWTVRSVSRSHVGRVRKINEDRVLDCAARGLWAVADGMGGHAAGDVAAEAVVASLKALTDAPAEIDANAIEAVLAYTGRRLHARMVGGTRMSGSTVVALHLRDGAGTLLWVGDSRAYRLRDGVLTRLSHDHSVVQELIDAGALTPEMAERHPKAHVVTRALGATSEVEIDIRSVDVRPGDLYLLCSDGLSRGAGDPDLAGLAARPIEAIADVLLDRALSDGGQDNISLVLIDVGCVRESAE
jgi:serine/threonine protein phosphatase PrpC